MTVNISLPKPLVKRADRLAKMEYGTRSDVVRAAIAQYIDKKEQWADLLAYGKRVGKKMGIKSEEDAFRIADE